MIEHSDSKLSILVVVLESSIKADRSTIDEVTFRFQHGDAFEAMVSSGNSFMAAVARTNVYERVLMQIKIMQERDSWGSEQVIMNLYNEMMRRCLIAVKHQHSRARASMPVTELSHQYQNAAYADIAEQLRKIIHPN
jgi:hypothetical protein